MLTFLDVDFTPLKQVLACLPLRYHDSHRAVAGGAVICRSSTADCYGKLSNAADKSTATQIVRSGGFLWLNPIGISVVICSRAEVVE